MYGTSKWRWMWIVGNSEQKLNDEEMQICSLFDQICSLSLSLSLSLPDLLTWGNPKFNFHKYMIRALEDDFKKVVGISWYLWIFVVSFLLLNVNDMRKPKLAAEIAKQLRRFHQVEIPGFREPQLWNEVFKFFKKASTLKFDDSEKQRKYETISFEEVEAEVVKLKELTSRLAAPVVFAHNDLLSGNLMLNDEEEKLYFIDFEYGSYNYRGFDIGNHFNEYAGYDCDYSLYPSKVEQFHFFRHYLEPEKPLEVSDKDLQALYVETNTYMLASHLYWALWALIQRSPFAPALAEALRDRVFGVDDSERQLHIIYLANDILFDSLQRRINPHELDNEALAFKPVLGSMLARIYHNPQNKEENQSRLQKILQFWASKEVYDHVTIHALENEMIGGPPTNFFPKELSAASTDPSTAGLPQLATNHNALQWQLDKQGSVPILTDKDYPDKLVPSIPAMPSSLATQPFLPNSVPTGPFTGSIPIQSSLLPANQQTAPHLLPPSIGNTGEKLPPYPLFPPGLIPGMVRKMQIGSGVPYSPMSPLDIPTVIPPSNVSPSEILNSVSKFFKEIGEVNPSEGPMNGSDSKDDDDEYERDSPVRKGGACIPPPPNLQVDPETGTYADGSVERKPGSSSSGRLGLGAAPDPNEASQYDDVYSSYRKQRSSNYHTSMSARAATAR